MQLQTPHSIFALGRVWPNPDDPHEPYWLPLDAGKAITYVEWEAEKHDRCGQHPAAWSDEHGVELDDPPFEVVSWHCTPCELLDDWAEARKESTDESSGWFPAFKRIDDE